jgi:Na+/H+-dicarboxylate symporter
VQENIMLKDGNRFSLIAILIASVALGIVAARSALGFSWAAAILYVLVLAASQILFFLVLPKFLKQPMQILAAMAIGIFVGWLLQKTGHEPFVLDYIGIYGTLFILLLKLVILPLIFVSIVCGVAGIGDIARLGTLGAKAMGYYICTTAVAVSIGLLFVNIIQPGLHTEGLDISPSEPTQIETASTTFGRTIQDKIFPAFIQNPIMAGQNPLVIIFFALLLGAALAVQREISGPAIEVFRGLDRAFITIVLWVMKLAPIGVFALMSVAIARLGLDYIGTLALYCLTVLLSLGLHWCLLIFVLLGAVLRVSPLRFIKGMAPAFQLAFSTSSSSATLPVTIDCASRRVGVDKDVASFMLPIGATINMDGTALYQAIAALFIAQIYGIDLSIGQQLVIFFIAVAMSIGTAGIPGAGLALLVPILSSANIPLEGIGIVAGVDRFIDMCRTFVNVSGDSVGTVLVSKSEGSTLTPAEINESS